jgi:hypothetical protein
MSRGFMGILSGIALLIALGLILTHSKETSAVAGTFFTGLEGTIRDLQMLPQSGPRKT